MAEAVSSQLGESRFQALDGLRGIASLFVLLAHFCSATGQLTHFPGLFNAVLAVDTFFVLSGFVLAHSFLSREQRGQPIAPVALLVQRWIRLWVPFAAATLIGIGLRFGMTPQPCTEGGGLLLEYCERWSTPESVGSLARQLIFFYSPHINAPSWTLPVEMINSLLVPALVVLLARFPGYVAMLGGLSVLSTFLPIVLPSCLYLFVAGCALRLWVETKYSGRWLLPVFSLSYLLFIPITGVKQDTQQVLLAPAAIALVLLALNSTRTARLMCHPWAQSLGRLSFPLYLLHWPLLLGLYPKLHAILSSAMSETSSALLLSGAIYILITVSLSLIFYYVVEETSIQFGRMLRRRIRF